MSFMKIVVPVNGTSQDDVALSLAFMAGAPFKAHVVALFRHPYLAKEPSYITFLTTDVGAQIVQEISEGATASQNARARLDAVSTKFRAQGSDGSRQMDFLTFSYCEVGGQLTDAILDSARLADMVVFGSMGGNHNLELVEAFSETLAKSKRPVLLAPHDSPKTFAQRIVVGWDGCHSAAHALTTAIPFLARARNVDIIEIRRLFDQPARTNEVKTYLGLHGVSCVSRVIDADQRDVGELLLDAAEHGAADLLVMGGYGHSRLRESVLGGVTRHVVSHAKIPIFLVH
jgi:nucleotide-binding universal stress UspA family protein